MSTSPLVPLSAVAKAGRDMELLFESFFSSIESLRENKTLPAEYHDVNSIIGNISSSLWTPRVEREEDKDEIRIKAHLPNVPSDQIRIDTSTHGRLKIYGECSTRIVYEDNGDCISERQLGQFEKDILLPTTARVEQMTAVFEGHLLVIVVPKVAHV
ncbi:hypothetical protein H4S08_002970 [Coemansia sp. RSA 1365]|nr:hypothetical protein H4S08_002970 [Coemansia sp. RSA 1365]